MQVRDDWAVGYCAMRHDLVQRRDPEIDREVRASFDPRIRVSAEPIVHVGKSLIIRRHAEGLSKSHEA